MKCKSSWIRKTVLIVRLSTSCRNVWRTKCTSTSRCSSRCRMRGGSTSCSRFCRWKGWIKCRNAALCCWILPVTLTVLSTTILMVTVLPRQCLCRSTIQRIRRCSVSLWSAHIRRSSATCTTCSVIPKRLTCSCSLTVVSKWNCLTKAIPWRTCCNMYSSIRKRC
ncbi:hypothetical protein HmCmsJML018_01478 [Escherichia coli]|nr:hypothetical protein BvCmsC29A_03525 [Escherichia coli]GCS54806.1 hypothetical protein HmCmsJML018_01478 [Escherichia coli]